jgi:CRP/FNR family cyclic AMP-dependent transcriptional regulator
VALSTVQTEEIRIDQLPSGRLGSLCSYSKGETIWRRGEKLDGIYFVHRGQVDIVVEDDRGRQCILRIVQPGEAFGLDCFSSRRREHAPTTAVATVQSEILKVPCEEFMAFIRGNEKAAVAMLATLSESLSYAEDRLRVLLNHDAEDRLCSLLEQLTQRFGHPSRDDPAWQRLQLTHAQLADLAGLSRSHVSLMMARLRGEGIIRYGWSRPLKVDTVALTRRRDQRRLNSKRSKEKARRRKQE